MDPGETTLVLDDPVAGPHCPTIPPTVDAARSDVLAVSFSRPPDRVVEDWSDRREEPPGHLHVLCANDSLRTSAPANAIDIPVPWVDVSMVNPANLTGFGVRLTGFLDRFDARRRRGEAENCLVCFDSLTAFASHVDADTLVRFLELTATETTASGAIGHFHITPGAHDDALLDRVRGVLDSAVDSVS